MGKINILHVTPHLGGGVGRVVLNYLETAKTKSAFEHQVACLDYANDHALAVAANIGFKLVDKLSDNQEQLIAMIAAADVVLVHWWNHPLLYDFLVRVALPPCHLVLWSHTSGFNAPYVFTEKILNYPDLFVLTTPVSLETKEIKNLSDGRKLALRVIWSTGGVEHVKAVQPKAYAGFNVGYIGTVDYAKLHPDFLKICDKINIPDVKFIVCGGANEAAIKAEAEAMGIAAKFIFTGLISDITEYLPIFDVFGYPLAPYHYGTCDQVLAESMAAGVVPVVLPNSMEKYMVKDGLTGLVAKNEGDYVRAVEELYKNKALRETLSRNARQYAMETFSLDKLAGDWEAVFQEVLNIPKTGKQWKILKNSNNLTAKDIFLEALGDYGQVFVDFCKAESADEKMIATAKIAKLGESPVWQSKTKGTVHQYCLFFPNDEDLAHWSDLIKNNETN